MTTYYANAGEYIENFDINAKIVDTEERDKMCEYWGKYAYSKVYLMYWSYDPTSDKNYWYKEEVYWTGWEWNEENNHLHGIGTMRDINNEDEEQKSHNVFDLGFIHIISEKKLKEIKKELLENKNEKSPDELELRNITEALLKHNKFHRHFLKYTRKMNSGVVPGILDITYPIIDNVK